MDRSCIVRCLVPFSMLESRSPNHFQNLERRTISHRSHRLLAIDPLPLSIQAAPLRRPLLSPQKGRDCIRSYGHLCMARARFLWQNYNPRSSICSKRTFNELKRGSVLIDSIQGLYMDALQFTPPLQHGNSDTDSYCPSCMFWQGSLRFPFPFVNGHLHVI